MIRIEAAHLELSDPRRRAAAARCARGEAIVQIGLSMDVMLAAFALTIRRPEIGEEDARFLLTNAPKGKRSVDELCAWVDSIAPLPSMEARQ